MSEPLLSVCLITYNHSKYIKEAIDGVLMQNVNFTWELIIADDCSTDGTREILLAYKEKYPDFINLILQEKNVGPAKNWIDLIMTPKAKYIAYFEGDDYWIDPNKLQKQIDFLENNPEFSLCFHNAFVHWEDKSKPPEYFCPNLLKKISTIEDVIKTWFIPSASIVFRNEYIMPLPDYFKTVYNGDYALILLLADNGPLKFIDEAMSVYRRQPGSFSYDPNRTTDFVLTMVINTLTTFDETTKNKYHNLILERNGQINIQIKSYKLKKKYPVLFHIFHPILTLGKILRDCGLFIISKKIKNND